MPLLILSGQALPLRAEATVSAHRLSGAAFGRVQVVPVPPLIGRGLRVAFRRVLPGLLASERRRIEVAPGAPHRLVAAAVDEVGAKDPVVVPEEHVVAVPLVHTEIDVEA